MSLLHLAYEMQRPTLDDHAVIEETIAQCVLADQMGFDYVWFVEHHFLTGFSMSPSTKRNFRASGPLMCRRLRSSAPRWAGVRTLRTSFVL